MAKRKQAHAVPFVASSTVFRALLGLVLWTLTLQLTLVVRYRHRDDEIGFTLAREKTILGTPNPVDHDAEDHSSIMHDSLPKKEHEYLPPHLFPPLTPLPPFAAIENGQELADATLGGQPTIAGLMSVLNTFLSELHEKQKNLSARHADRDSVIATYVDLAKRNLLPLDDAYRGRPVFTIREDDSIYVSVAAFRDYKLGETLKSMFREAENPQKLFVGAVVQNCFGNEYTCKTGVQVIGKDANGHDMTKVSDAPPDKNGVAEFCNDKQFEKYCSAGQIRALYVNETESIGPAMARYWASKLWGGETYFVQIDSHLSFADRWDSKYIAELRVTKSYPMSILSAYPPGVGSQSVWNNTWKGSPGTKLCACTFAKGKIERQIIRLNAGSGHKHLKDAPLPPQIPFMGAGFFFTRAEFLVDVPFDPYLPWVFMGEEIALSIRSWTSGWNMYAPRKSWVAHQYRPGKMGLPKFWEAVGRTYGRGGRALFQQLQDVFIERIKYMVGYPEVTRQAMLEEGNVEVLTELEHYGLGTKRSRGAYLEFAKLDMREKQCRDVDWCRRGDLF